jgi:hypothetical protein
MVCIIMEARSILRSVLRFLVTPYFFPSSRILLSPDDGDDSFFRNVLSYKSHTMSHPRRRHFQSHRRVNLKSYIALTGWDLYRSNVFAVTYELGFYIPEDGTIRSHRRENLKSYITLTGWVLYRRRNVFPVRYELGFYIPEDGILHSYRRENLKSYIELTGGLL